MRRSLFLPEWHRRLCFVFLFPPPNDIYLARCACARHGTHPVDREFSRETVSRQRGEYAEMARLLVAAGFRVLAREPFDGPLPILSPDEGDIYRRKPATNGMTGAVWPLVQ